MDREEYWKNRKAGKRGQGEYPTLTKDVGHQPRQRPKRVSKKQRLTEVEQTPKSNG